MKTIKSLYIIPVALVTTTLLTGLVLTSIITKADGNTNVTDTLNITVNSACTMMGGPTGESTTDNTYTATIDPGTYQEISGSKLVTVCNDALGYSIYAIGYSGDSYDSNTHTDLIGTGSIGNIQTGTSGTNSYWAMKLEAVSGVTPPTILNSFDNYHVIPNSYTQIAKQTTATATPSSTGASVQTKYKVNISSSQTAGSYTGKVKYTMVHPNNAPAPTPPSSDVSFDDAYAAAGKTKLNNYYKMQDMSSTICSAVTLEDDESETTLIDSRDNKTYTVSKLKDGNCWMTQNLDHDIKTDGTVTYNSTTTDVPETWTPSTATYPTGATTWEWSTTAPESYNPGELYWNGTADTEYPSTETDCTAAGGTWDSVNESCNFISSTGNSHYHLGNYYNWTAAVAMNDSSSYDTQDQDANQSICPANWTLPKSGHDTPASTAPGSSQYLITQYGWDSEELMMTNPYIWNSPIKTSLSGLWYGLQSDVGAYGAFWSSIVSSSDDSYSLSAYSDGYVDPEYNHHREGGYSVRCLARTFEDTTQQEPEGS